MRSTNKSTRDLRPARHVFAGASAIRFESLEGRKLMTGVDLQFVDSGTDAAPTITSSADAFARVPLPGGFKWMDASSDWKLSTGAPAGTFKKIAINGPRFMPWVDGKFVEHGAPSEVNTRAYARSAASATDTLVINIESWNMDLRGAKPQVVDQSVGYFRDIIRWIRSEAPQMKIGIYGYMSITDQQASTEYGRYNTSAAAGEAWFMGAMPQTSDKFADWQAASDYLQLLAQDVDYVFPSLYTTGDFGAWAEYANATIDDARRYGKPVIPFLWPQYHNSAGSLGLQFMPGTLWQQELDLIRGKADGAAIWTDYSYPVVLTAPWAVQSIATALRDTQLLGGTGLDELGGEDDETVANAAPEPLMSAEAGDTVAAAPATGRSGLSTRRSKFDLLMEDLEAQVA